MRPFASLRVTFITYVRDMIQAPQSHLRPPQYCAACAATKGRDHNEHYETASILPTTPCLVARYCGGVPGSRLPGGANSVRLGEGGRAAARGSEGVKKLTGDNEARPSNSEIMGFSSERRGALFRDHCSLLQTIRI